LLRTVGRAAIIATIFVIAVFVAMFIPGLQAVSEWLLGPGYALPEAYWGAVHDVLQLFLVVFLDVLFYTAFFTAAIWGWRRWRRP
jgi:hypothetical protein